MSLFKKPKKIAQRRIFTSEDGENNDNDELTTTDNKDKKKDKREKEKPKKPSLLSFGDEEEEEGEIFQVKKSSFSKRIHKERKRKNKPSEPKSDKDSTTSHFNNCSPQSQSSDTKKSHSPPRHSSTTTTKDSNNLIKEIHSDEGFSIRLKNSNPENLILNGRAALCAGRDEMSSEEEEEVVIVEDKSYDGHKFSRPDDQFQFNLESGAIPDARLIHEARKRRQKAREQGEFIALEDNQEELKKGKRIIREEDAEGNSSEEERVDMSAITGVKEREERREKFYSVQANSEEDSDDVEMNEWENQQIRKGVTGAQLMSAQQESIYSQYMIQPFSSSFSNNSNSNSNDKAPLSTAELLEQAYSHTSYEVSKQLRKELRKKEGDKKSSGPKTPREILKLLRDKLEASKDLNHKHFNEIDRLAEEFQAIRIDLRDCELNGPVAAGKYRFYQELKLYIDDLVECLNEKLPVINALEEKSLNVMEKYAKKLIERRRQDVRDQAKELTDTNKFSKKAPEDEERIRRAAEREGRRTRRRRNREKLNMSETHNDGMSSDDEVPDVELAQYKEQLSQIKSDVAMIFDDVSDDYCDISQILQRFAEWKLKDLSAYKEAFVHLCLPKITSVFIRAKLILWSPFEMEFYEDIEKMDWFDALAMYGKADGETEETLRNDPDVFLIPTVIEKVILPKLNKLMEECWDPLSTTETLKLVKIMNQLSHDYPSLRDTSKNLHSMFTIITEKMKTALDNDVFIPIFQKQSADAKTSFFQRQFYSGVKLFRNFISFQGIVSDKMLKNYAISSLLNRYLLSAMRVSSPSDGITKAYMIVLTLPRVWLIAADKSLIESMGMFAMFVSSLENQFDRKIPGHLDSIEKLKQITSRLELMASSK